MNEEPTTTQNEAQQHERPEAAAREEEAAREEAAAGDGAAAGEQDEAEALAAERDALNDRLLRQMAEFQNYRRRSEEEKGRLIHSSKARALTPMLDVLDDFERTMAAAEQFEEMDDAEAAYASLHEGLQLVLRKFQDALAKLDVEPIEAVGAPFHEAEHEAMMQQPAPEGIAPGTVLGELQKGYRLGDRVLRHSRVVVSS